MALPVFDPRALYVARVSKGWSRRALAGRSGVSRETIRRVELGLFEPRADTLDKLAQALDLSAPDLMTEAA